MLDVLSHTEWCKYIRSIIKRYYHVCNQDVLIEIEDLEQEAWRALLIAAKNYRQDKARGKFTSYAWIYIHNNVRHFAYSRADKSRLFINESDIDSEVSDVEDTFDDFKHVDLDDAFQKVVQELSCEDMVLIDQRFIQEMTYKEMAQAAGVRPQTMQIRVADVVGKLQKRMNIEDIILRGM